MEGQFQPKNPRAQSVLTRIRANANLPSILHNLQRGPAHWLKVGGEVAGVVIQNPFIIARKLSLEKLYRGVGQREWSGLISEKMQYTLFGEVLGFSRYFDLRTNKLGLYNYQVEEGDVELPILEFFSRIITKLPSLKSLNRLYIAGPTYEIGMYRFMNGLRVDGDVFEIEPKSAEFNEIPPHKGGIGLSTNGEVKLLDPEQTARTSDSKNIGIIFGASVFFEEETNGDLSDEALFTRAVEICDQNGYWESYNTRYGFLVQREDGNLMYFVVASDPILEQRARRLLLDNGLTDHRLLREDVPLGDYGTVLDDYSLNIRVPFAVFALMKLLNQGNLIKGKYRAVALEEHYTAIPLITNSGREFADHPIYFVHTFNDSSE